MQRILGIDLGSYSIKVISILYTYKEYLVEGLFEEIIPEIGENEDEFKVRQKTLQELIQKNNLDADKVFVAMPGRLVSNRILNFHNIKKKDLTQFVENELENIVPFPLAEYVFDYEALTTKNNSRHVMVVLCSKENIVNLLDFLEEIQLSPKIVDVDNLAFLNAASFLPSFHIHETATSDESEENTESTHEQTSEIVANPDRFGDLIIDVGHLKTSLILMSNQKFMATRVINIGGRYFTEVLKRSFDISYSDAMKLKHYVSRIDYKSSVPDEGISKEQLIAKRLAVVANELSSEILRSVHSFRVTEGYEPRRVFLTGGGSCLEGFQTYLQEQLNLPVDKLSFHSPFLKFKDNIIAESPLIGQSLAIAIRGLPNKFHSKINLRKGDLALVGNYDKLINKISTIAIAAASFILILFISYFIRYISFSSELNLAKTQFRKQVVAVLKSEPKKLSSISSKKNWDFTAYSQQTMTLLKNTIEEKKQLISYFQNKKTLLPFRVIQDISKRIPKELYFEIVSFKLRDDKLSIEAETTNFENSDKVVKLIKESPYFNNVEKVSQDYKPGSDQSIIRFSIAANMVGG